MKFSLSKTAPKVDVLFLPMFSEEKLSTSTKKLLGAKVVKQIETHLKAKDFEGGKKEALKLFSDDKKFKKVVLLGLGKKKELGIHTMTNLGGKSASIAKSNKATSIAAIIDEDDLQEFASGFVLGNYSFDRYKKKDKKAVELKNVTFVSSINKNTKEVLRDTVVFSESQKTTRDLVNMPAGDMTPVDLAKEAKKIASKYKMKIKILDDKKLKAIGCGAIIGVGIGALNKPRMVILEYKHRSKSKTPNLAFVGKGITFDTGGLNLKPTGYMETMKQDMAGAATVIGTMQAIAEAKLSGHFVGVLGIAENAVSENATRPGDVLKAYNGKTIEVTNTDAEGRLVLADCLAYTEAKLKPKAMVNIATLTGAVSVALGYHITGVMGNNKSLVKETLEAAKDAKERLWELPLDDDFVEAAKGDFTDLKNSTNGVRAGCTMGAAFLKNFVDKVKWAHFDIGGTAWADKPTPTTKYGATGAMLRTFFELAKNHGS